MCNAVLYCMDSTLQRLRAVCAATARLLYKTRMTKTRREYSLNANIVRIERLREEGACPPAWVVVVVVLSSPDCPCLCPTCNVTCRPLGDVTWSSFPRVSSWFAPCSMTSVHDMLMIANFVTWSWSAVCSHHVNSRSVGMHSYLLS